MPAICLVLWVLLGGGAPAPAGVPSADCSVQLRAEVSVAHVELVLGDIADLSGKNPDQLRRLAGVVLGPVADVRILSRSDVEARIRSACPELGEVRVTGPGYTRVALTLRIPDAGELAAVLKAHLASASAWRPEEIEVRSIDNLAGIRLPPGEVRLRVSSRGLPSSFRSALLAMEAQAEGLPPRTFWVKADVRVRARVVQLARAVPYGSALRDEDLREVECEIPDPRCDYVRTAAEAAGMTARRALVPGDLLNRSFLHESRLVHSGETVRLWQQAGGVKVAALGRALQNGNLGDRIKVRNADTDRTITAVVTGRGEVRVVR